MLRTLATLALAAPFWLAAASDAFAPAPVFGGPEVVKLDWNTRGLLARDIDGDGRTDLVLLNNDRAAIELLYQLDPAAPAEAGSVASSSARRWEPTLEDARFRRVTQVIGQSLFDVVAGDFDGDGRVDLAITGDPLPLLLRFRREDGSWEERPVATAPAPARLLGSIFAGDIDGDGLDDLVILGQRELVVFRQRPGEGLVADERLPISDENPYGLLVADLDGDGRVDISYLVPGRREAMRVRLQIAPGRFGPEMFFPMRTPRSPLVAVRGGAASCEAKGSPLLASAPGASGQVEFARLVSAEGEDRWRGLSPRVFSPMAGVRGPALYATGDFNRDGASDVAVAFAETAQIHLYLRQPDGDFAPALRVPSLTDARSLSAGAAQSGADHDVLYVLSGKENALAEIVIGEDGSAAPPRALAVPGRVIGVAAGALSGELAAGLAVVAEEEGKRALTLWSRDAEGKLARGASIELKGMRADPRSVTLADINGDGRADVLLSVPLQGVRVFLQQADGTLVDAADNPAYRPGLLARAEAATAPLAFGDVDGDGKDELLVGAENFLRALRVNEAGELVIVAQFDARDPSAEITTGFLLPGEKSGSPEVILHERKADQLHLLRPARGGGGHETVDVRDVARLDVTGAMGLVGPGGRREYLLLGRDRFWWLPEGGANLAIETEGVYASDLPDVRYFYLSTGDFDRDGRDELVAIDIRQNTLEVLGRGVANEWGSRLHFKIFDSDPHYGGNRGGGQEPRECVIADVTGDGKPDLVLLVHDRVLVYPQE
jgi:hypothetical protein